MMISDICKLHYACKGWNFTLIDIEYFLISPQLSNFSTIINPNWSHVYFHTSFSYFDIEYFLISPQLAILRILVDPMSIFTHPLHLFLSLPSSTLIFTTFQSLQAYTNSLFVDGQCQYVAVVSHGLTKVTI